MSATAPTAALVAALLASVAAQSPATEPPAAQTQRALTMRYRPGVAVVVETELGLTWQDLPIEREGHPPPWAGSGRSGQELRRLTVVDLWVDAPDDGSLCVRRTLERLEATSRVDLGASVREREPVPLLVGRALELVRAADGSLQVEWVGERPDDPDGDLAFLLAGREPELGLAALLPSAAVPPGTSWALDDRSLRRALRALVDDGRFFQDPRSRPEGAVALNVNSLARRPLALLRAQTWSGRATLEAEDAAWRGAPCAAIRLELRAGFDEERGPYPGRAWFAAEGRLLYDPAAARPVLLSIEGRFGVERQTPTPDGGAPERLVTEGRLDLAVEVFERTSQAAGR